MVSGFVIEDNGIGLTDMDLEAVRVTFSMNLQPIKTKKQKCRGGSAWQATPLTRTSKGNDHASPRNNCWRQWEGLHTYLSIGFALLPRTVLQIGL